MATKRAAKRSKGKATRSAKPSAVSVYVNGQLSTHFPTFAQSKTLADLVKEVGQAHGLRGATVKINGEKVDNPNLAMTLTGVQSVELISKETRG